MSIKKLICLELIVILTISTLAGCGTKTTTKQNGETVTEAATETARISDRILYKSSGQPNYEVYCKKSIDLFLIAAGLYFDFDNQYLLPNAEGNQLYKKAKAYFTPYKDNQFIKDFSKYVTSANDVNSSYMEVLLNYSDLPELGAVYEDANSDSQQLINGLKAFYTDTNAEQFFKDNEDAYDQLETYINQNVESSKISTLISDAEAYTGNKDKYYSNTNMTYCTLISFFRNAGSFATLKKENDILLVSMQCPYKNAKTSEEFSMDGIIKTSVHEYLHNYINTPVLNNKAQIESLTANKDRKDYVSSLYTSKSFPWNRVTDENFVRAVESRIYKKEFGDQAAKDAIVTPEVKAGFKQVLNLYNKLEEYESNRAQFPMIDDYIPTLIQEMYQ